MARLAATSSLLQHNPISTAMSNLAEVPQLAARSAIADTAKVPQEPEHLEMLDAKLPAEAATDAVAPVSAFAHCSKREILRKFWRLVLTGFAVSLGAMYVGYGLAVTGSIIANPGERDPHRLCEACQLTGFAQASSPSLVLSTRPKDLCWTPTTLPCGVVSFS